MRTHFLERRNNNHTGIKKRIKLLYSSTLDIFKLKLQKYCLELPTADQQRQIDLFILIPEVNATLQHLENEEFMNYFIDWNIKLLEQIRFITIIKHTEECIIRATFDIIFKYAFDFEYQISFSCCTTDEFKKLQFNILNDCLWKIRDSKEDRVIKIQQLDELQIPFSP